MRTLLIGLLLTGAAALADTVITNTDGTKTTVKGDMASLQIVASTTTPPPQPPPPPPPTPTAGIIPAGIQQLQMVWTSKSNIDSTLARMHKDLPGLPWVRLDLQDNDPTQIANFTEEVKVAKSYGMKVLALMSTTQGDVGGGSFPYPLSKVSPSAVSARVKAYFDALKAAGLMVDAVEVGNELDQTAFNSDAPSNTSLFVSSYAKFLKAVTDVVKPNYPSVKVVTVGFANMMSFCPSCHLSNPPAALAQLKNLNGVNYLASVDGYGMHVYPMPDQIQSWTQGIFDQYKNAGLTDKPIYITEWGFHRASFPYNGQPRSWADQQWLSYVQGYKGLSFAATFLFDYNGDAGENYDYDIFDNQGTTLRQDEANVLINWNKQTTLTTMGVMKLNSLKATKKAKKK